MASVDLTKPEVSVRIMRCAVIYGEHSLGRERLIRCLEGVGDLSLTYLSDESNWVSMSYLEDLLVALTEESGDPSFSYKAGLHQAGPEVMPIGRSFLRALGKPRVMFEVIFGVGSRVTRVNGVGQFTIEDVSDTSMSISYRPRSPEFQERNSNLHHLRRGQIAALPRLFGLPSAQATEHKILPDGEGSWYRFTWADLRERHSRQWAQLIGGIAFVFGGLLWAGLSFLSGDVSPLGLYVLVSATAIGYLLGKHVEDSEVLTAKEERIEEVERRKEDVQESLLQQDSQLKDKVEVLQAAREELVVKNEHLKLAQEQLESYNKELELKVKERTEKIEQAIDQLKAADELKTRFFSSINHELRTPLTLILAPLEAILTNKTRLDKSQIENLQTMHSNGLRLLKLINDMLDLSKFGARRVRLRYEDIDLAVLVNKVVNSARPTINRAALAINLDIPDSLDHFHADREKIEQIFYNLISNSVKFTPRGGRIGITITEEPAYFCIEVSDSGIGIHKELQANIFDRFSVGGNQAIRGYGGTGLGLSLVKEIVDLHEGKIHIESDEGIGTRFLVKLPKGKAHVKEELRDRRTAAPQPTAGGRRMDDLDRDGRLFDPWISERSALELNDLTDKSLRQRLPVIPPHQPGRKTLLLVDDRVEMLFLLVQLLGADYNLLTAINGNEALQVALDHRPNLVLSDVMMPDKDGYELCRDLKSDIRTEKIPVILLSAKEAGELVKEGDIMGEQAQKGADDFLTKPFSTRELKARVSSQLRLKQMEADLRENNRRLQELATTDPLTGLLNRREFERRLKSAFKTARESGRSLALVMFDIDFFRNVNNTYGHQAGDRVLSEVANDTRSFVEVHGVAGRYGGEEFILFFPGWTQERANRWAQEIRLYIEKQRYLAEYPNFQLTISMGVAAIPEVEAAAEDVLIKLADEALYRAKDAGRNQVVCAA